jgi:hypothetical protein
MKKLFPRDKEDLWEEYVMKKRTKKRHEKEMRKRQQRDRKPPQ